MNQKKKGNRGERMAVQFLRSWTGWDFDRTPQSGGLRWKKADNISGDIVCTEPNKLCYISFEVKFPRDLDFEKLLRPQVNCDIKDYWKQTVDDSIRAKKMPMLLMRKNGLPKDLFFVAMPFMFGRNLTMKNRMWVRMKDTASIIITTTNDMETLKWKDVNKAAKKWLKDQPPG